ncbi:MAG: ATP-dependent helicase [Desulfobacteraceae bacterium]
MELSEQQRSAVEHEGTPALVVAGAGSGKTRTLTAKISKLVRSGADPERILAITFTNKAADEMKSRLQEVTGYGFDRFPWVRTYHSACLLILKSHCRLLGYDPPVQVLSVYQQKKTVKEVLMSHNMDRKLEGRVLSMISRAKNSGNPEKYFDYNPGLRSMNIRDLFKAYEKKLFRMNSVDFDNILLKARDILRDHGEVRKYYREYFTHILVDEYQDTNDLQEEITRLLLGDHGNLFCVGDDWQAVYGFRGSNVNHFLRFPEQYRKARVFRLEENFRSADEIVQAANDLIDYNPDKMDKKCFSRKTGGRVEIREFFSDLEEAEWVARRLIGLDGRGQGIPFEKTAVVYRTKFCSLPFEKTFRKFGIPYRMVGNQGFFERMEILDVNSYLNAAVFPSDDVSFERILNTPKRGIGPSMIKKINSFRSGDMSLREAAGITVREKVLSKKVHENLTFVLELLDTIKDLAPDRAIDEVVGETGYKQYLEKVAKTKDEYIAKLENIEQLRYTAREKNDLYEYLEEAALIREDSREDESRKDQGVSLLTIHSAKGLEFDAVFIVGCEENLFPHWRSLQEGEEELSEERRLMYVAMTRAEQYLYLTCSNYRKGQFACKSRFLDHVEEYLDGA